MSKTTAPGRRASLPDGWTDTAHREEQPREGHLRTAGIGSWLIALACRQYPAGSRDDRTREFTTELRYILADPGASRLLRPARALLYAADHLRGAWRMRHRHPSRDATTPDRAFPAAASIEAALIKGALRYDRNKAGARRSPSARPGLPMAIYRRK